MNIENCKTLLIGPGGSSIYLCLGSILALSKFGRLNNIKTFIGVKGGAVLAGLLAAKIDINCIMAIFSDNRLCIGFSKLAKLAIGEVSLLENLTKILSDILLYTYGYIPTLEVLKSLTGNDFICTATDLETREEFICSAKKTPKLKLNEAILISCGFPLMVSRVYFDNRILASGDILCPLPYHLVDINQSTLFLATTSKPINQHSSNVELFYKTLNFPIETLQNEQIKYIQSISNWKIIIFQNIFVDPTTFTLTPKNLIEIIKAGIKQTEKYLPKLSNISLEPNYNELIEKIKTSIAGAQVNDKGDIVIKHDFIEELMKKDPPPPPPIDQE